MGCLEISKLVAEYFLIDSTVHKLLDLCGQVFGLAFTELLGNKGAKVKELYSQNTKYLQGELKDVLLFTVQRHNFWRGLQTPLGVLTLDLVDERGKPKSAHCAWFGQARIYIPRNIKHD